MAKEYRLLKKSWYGNKIIRKSKLKTAIIFMYGC